MDEAEWRARGGGGAAHVTHAFPTVDWIDIMRSVRVLIGPSIF